MTAWYSVIEPTGVEAVLRLAAETEAAGWVAVATVWGIVALLIAINGIFVAAEIALVGVRPTHLAALAERGSVAAKGLLQTLESPERQRRYFASTQMGITTASIGLGMYGEHQLAALFAPTMERLGLGSAAAHAIAVPMAVVLLTFLHVVIGEMLPKSLALRFPGSAVQRIAPLMVFTQTLLRPVVALLSGLSGLVLRLLPGAGSPDEARFFTARELGRTIADTAAEGLIHHRDERILLDVIDFGNREVHQVMTARTRIVALPLSEPESSLAQQLAGGRHTRFPVFDGDLDHIVGVLHIKDYLRDRQGRDPGEPFSLESLLREAHVVPEHLPLTQLLEQFRRSREHMALVIDEYGGTAGIVTLEDVVEELVGEVRDEFDVGEVVPIRHVGEGLYIVRGDVQLADLEAHVRLAVDRPDVDTVGGLVVNLLGRPAEAGESVQLGDATFTAQRVDGYTVELVRVAVPSPSDRDAAMQDAPQH